MHTYRTTERCSRIFRTALMALFTGGFMFLPFLDAAPGGIGKIGDIDQRKREVIVRSGVVLQMGEKIFVRIDGKPVILNVTFPMQTVAKCSLTYEHRGYFGRLEKGMDVFRYVKGMEAVEEKTAKLPGTHGEVKTIGGIEFVFIQGGEYMMGSPEGEGDMDELPAHRAEVNSLWVSKYEITQEQYEGLMEMNPSEFIDRKNPVENVEWYNAMDFSRRFSSKNSVSARLPYEAEWEYACRAGTSTKYYWGDKMNGSYCWYADNSGNLVVAQKAHPVGRKKPNAWGLHDTIGNVFEWCMDAYAEDYYKTSPVKNPRGPEKGESRVMRGGCFSYLAESSRPAVRAANDPSRMFSSVGFRMVLEAE